MLSSQMTYPADMIIVWPLTPEPRSDEEVTFGIQMFDHVEHVSYVKIKFDPCDPKWPQVYLWPNTCDRGSQTNAYELHEYTMLHVT